MGATTTLPSAWSAAATATTTAPSTAISSTAATIPHASTHASASTATTTATAAAAVRCPASAATSVRRTKGWMGGSTSGPLLSRDFLSFLWYLVYSRLTLAHEEK